MKPKHLVPHGTFPEHYVWIFPGGWQALRTDPGAAAPVTRARDANALDLPGILVTRHGDDAWRAGASGRPGLNLDRYEFEVFDVPGSRAGHIAFHAARRRELRGASRTDPR